MTDNHFDVLILIARPAAGKSEVIHYLKNVSDAERVRRFHIGPFQEIDDFPMLWTWFEEDDILERLGHPRLHTDAEGFFKSEVLWQLLIERIDLEYQKLLRDHPDYHERHTVIIEFSRGAEHGGYTEAFQHLSEDVLQRAAVLYIDVTFEESLRKNRKRFNPERADSILEHGLPDAKMERLYKEIDWEDFSAGDETALHVKGIDVPYVVFDNADDVTTEGGPALGERLEARLTELWERYSAR